MLHTSCGTTCLHHVTLSDSTSQPFLRTRQPAGSNGESLSLSVAERKALAEAWASEGPKVRRLC